MKHLLNINNFLNEYRVDKDIDINIEYINSKLDDSDGYWKWNIDDPQIWKGDWEIDNSHMVRIENTERSAKGYSKKIISKLPSWRKFSNRYKSIICSTSENTAKEWGDHFAVVPLKNEIVVGVSSDFNRKGCFPFFDEIFGTSNDFFGIIKKIEKLNKDINNNNILPVNHTPWIKKSLLAAHDILNLSNDESQKIFDNIFKFYPKHYINRIENNELDKLIKEQNFKNMLELFDYVFDPIRNGYKKMKYTDYINNIDEKTDTEVWFESDCFLISKSDFEKLKNGLV